MNATHFRTLSRADGSTTGDFTRISEEAEALKPHRFTGMEATGDGHTRWIIPFGTALVCQ
jgi:hypothetical protein